MSFFRNKVWGVSVTALLATGVLRALPPDPRDGIEPFHANPAAALQHPVAKKTGVNIEFIGTKNFRNKELRDALAEQIDEIDRAGLTPAAADDAAFFLGIFYRKNGFPDVDESWKIAADNHLILTVSEGPLVTLGRIAVFGNQHIPEAVLKDYVIGTTRERFPRLKQKLPFVHSDIETGIERIHGLYESEGFLNVSVDPAQITFSPDRSHADIAVTIHEGTQYHFGKLDFEGDLVFFNFQPGAANDTLLKTLEPFTKKPYTPPAVTNIGRQIVYYYRQHGYYDVTVDSKSDPATAKDGIVPVTFRVESGGIYRFGDVTESGLDRLHPGFLRRRFAKLHGKFYNPEKLDDIYRSLMRTGLFNSLRITSKPQPSHEIELEMEASETKAKELGFSLGYGTYEGFIAGIQATERDLFGTGRAINGAMELSQRYLKGEVQYSDPWFLESDYTLRLKLEAINQTLEGYSKVESGARLEFGRQISKHLNISVFMLPRKVELNSITIKPKSDAGPTRYFVNSLGTALTLDMRDSAINPNKGFIFTTTGDYAGGVLGSGLDFVRGTYRASYYIPIYKTMLAFGARGGIIFPLQGHGSIPIDERFFNGGSRSVRSFAEYKLGPTDSHGNPVGGETFTTLNAEYTFPIIGDLDGAVFFDAGSVGRTVSDGTGDFRYGIGGGLRYKLPVGPIRIDYGINPAPHKGEKSGAFNFSFGFAF